MDIERNRVIPTHGISLKEDLVSPLLVDRFFENVLAEANVIVDNYNKLTT